MYRPMKPKMHDPTNPEHSLVDAMTVEIHSLESPEIVYWSMKTAEEIDEENAILNPDADPYLDELDEVYGEKSSDDGKLMFHEPVVDFYAKVDINPIIQELTRLGLAQIEEIDVYVNIAHAQEKLYGPPKGGDVLRITFMIRDYNGELKEHLVYFKVSSVDPVDLYNFQYINYQINCEQTNMMDVPDEIKNYYIQE